MAYIDASKTLIPGVDRALKDTFKKLENTFKEQVNRWCRPLSKTELRRSFYAWYLALPAPKIWPYGMPRSLQSFDSVLTYVTLEKIDLSIEWLIRDQTDDLIKDLLSHATNTAERLGLMPIILLIEHLNGVAVENSVLELAYDGVPLFSDVDGDGNDRFGVSGGNIYEGTGLTPAAFINDIFGVQRRFMSFLDETAQKPLFEGGKVTLDKLEVIVPQALNEVVSKAAKAEFIQVNPLLTVPETNILKSTFSFDYNQLLTSETDYFVILKHPTWRPFCLRPMQDINQVVTNTSNSDKARMMDIAGVYADARLGVGLYMPQTIIKVTND